ncbi:hypothetical protein Q3G72_018109 [Acer saccharum]|nr:hypothetical protein Q3G72_018109 [Acer saccharum]
MGCVSSKQAVSVTPAALDLGDTSSGRIRVINGSTSSKSKVAVTELGESGRASESLSFRLGNLHKYIEGEQVAAGWPAWLTAVAGEAIQGWVPLRADAYEKLEKIGQGTYSSVFRARDLDTGKIVALKKYMEHDITGLLSCPDVKFTESQIKCYMKQLLSGLEHCHSRELLMGKPILQGRTEVEQLHKIFKLCGSPPDDYWKKSKLPHATLFKPQQPYDSCLQDTFKDLPTMAVNLIETLLSVEPYKRATASSALSSEYFTTKPYACDPSSLPKYPPSKEIDAKHREDARRKKIGGRVRGPETRKSTRKTHGMNKLAPVEDVAGQAQCPPKINGNNVHILKGDVILGREIPKLQVEEREEASHVKNASHGDIPFSGPLQVSTSSGFAWAKRRKDDTSIISHSRTISRGHINNTLESSAVSHGRNNYDPKKHDTEDNIYGGGINSRGHDYEAAKLAMLKQWGQFERPDSFDASDGYHSQELSLALYQREEMAAKRNNLGYQDQGDKVEFSGPLLSQSNRIDELLERHERQIRQAVRKSWFQRGRKYGK